MRLQLPDGLKLGAALSALQVEGGAADSTWNDWAARGKIKDGTTPEASGGHLERVDEDVAFARRLHLECLRTSVSWARLCPARGQVDERVLKAYRREFSLLKLAGVQLILTLHHFDEPMWFAKDGGFLGAHAAEDFLSFVRLCVTSFKDVCSVYIVFNEPNIYALNGYLYGLWPPGKRSPWLFRRVLKSMAECHQAAYALVHSLQPDAQVSTAMHVRAFDPLSEASKVQKKAAKTFERWYQTAIADAFYLGKSAFPVPKMTTPPGVSMDFCALNYYTRSIIGDWRLIPKNRPLNDLGWDIFPEGLTRVCRDFYARYQLPIMIAENGICDARDTLRAPFIRDHLRALCAACVPVTHYCYWSLLDNFEWLDGQTARFGLVHVDFATQERSLTCGALAYARMIEERRV